MSFILEALRKSENERRRLGNATLAELPIGRRQNSQPWWVFALGGLLVVNLGVLAVVLLRDRAPTAVAATPATASVAPTSSAPAPTQAAVQPQLSGPSMAATSMPAARSQSLSEQALPEPEVEYETVSRAEMEAAAAAPSGPTLVRSRNDSGESLPSSNAPADLRLNLHVYSATQQERFVMINMRRYAEGDALPDGGKILRITQQGVELIHRGERVSLAR
jgi:general secretion pathway protein B